MREIDDMEGIGALLFSAPEAALFGRLRGAPRTLFFFTCWVRKEALLKARGVGIGAELTGITVGGLPVPSKNTISFVESRSLTSHWLLQDLEIEPNCLGAFCVEGAECRLSHHHLGSDLTDTVLAGLPQW